MSKSKKKSKSSSQQKRSNKFMANKLRTNQSRSEFRANNQTEVDDIDKQSLDTSVDGDALAQDNEKLETVTPKVVNVEGDSKDPANEQSVTSKSVDTDKKTVNTDKDKSDKDKSEKDKDKQKKKDAKDKKGKHKFGQRTKETFAELKRVTWPTFGETMKKTGRVIAVVLLFGIVLFAFDRLLAWLFDLLTKNI